MVSSELQRTLVKSPPELWAELSDPDALARHLGELGEIRITKTKPEQTVEWEAADAQGRIELEQSGWGTKVTLQITRQAPQAAPAPEPPPCSKTRADPQAQTEPEALEPAQTEPTALEHAHRPAREPEPQAPAPEPGPAETEMETEAETAQRRGFFARLFKRRARRSPAPAPYSGRPAEEPAAEPQLAAQPDSPAEPETPPQPIAIADSEAAEPEVPVAGPEEIAAAPAAAEQAIAAQTDELLRTILDRLGAAHHRPFSRA